MTDAGKTYLIENPQNPAIGLASKFLKVEK
jgi:hypothetical protein